MNDTIQRLVATTTTALLLVATVGAGTVLATPAVLAATVAPDPERASSGRCAAQWDAARGEPTVARLQAVGRCEIDRRLDTLEKLQQAVDTSKALTDAHEAALEAVIGSTRSGLTALRVEIDAATTVPALREDLRRIAEEFRVYVLVGRQVRLVIGDDTVAAAVTKAEASAARVRAAVDAAETAGKDVAASRAHLATMTKAIAAAAKAVEGDATAVLAQTPARWNAGDAKPVLDAARASIREARSSLRIALREGRSAMADLR